MTILALDLGTKLGWAVSFGPGDILSGTMDFKVRKYEGGGMMWVRYRSWLNEMADKHGPIERVVFEAVRRHIGTDAAHIYGGFLAHLTAWCEKRGIPHEGIAVGTIKKHATGKGNASKPLMIAAMKKLGFAPKDDNEADALALLLCVQAEREAA